MEEPSSRLPREGRRPDDDTFEGVERQRVLRRNPRLRLLIGATVAFLAVAFVKPWGTGASAPVPPPAQHVAALTGGASPLVAAAESPVPTDVRPVATDICRAPDSWLVVDDDTEFAMGTRTWTVAAATTTATSVDDPTIPVTRIVAGPVLRLGFCAPSRNGDGNPGWHGTLWRVAPSGRPVDTILYAVPSGLAGALLPPSASVPASEHESPPIAQAWPAGHYVLAASVNGGAETWLAIDIVAGA